AGLVFAINIIGFFNGIVNGNNLNSDRGIAGDPPTQKPFNNKLSSKKVDDGLTFINPNDDNMTSNDLPIIVRKSNRKKIKSPRTGPK
ncbi:323_t:CDS:1, partial [Gigaspora rosea]